MTVVLTRAVVVIVSVLLLSWGSFANFNPVFATTSIEDLQKQRDDLDIEINNNQDTSLADKLEDARNKFQDVFDELNKVPPDVAAAIGNISAIQQEIQVAIDDEGFSPIIGNILIAALEAIKDKLNEADDFKVTICHDRDTKEVPDPEVAAHLAHGDTLGDCPPVEQEDDKDDDKKLSICHFPPGNPSNLQMITISENATKSHLAHGDLLGKCPDNDEADEQRKNIEREKIFESTLCFVSFSCFLRS